jgi:hypothetical protein
VKRLIQFHAIPNIGSVRHRYISVREWISDSRYSSIDNIYGGIFLEAYHYAELLSAISYDFERFACSSFESMELSRIERVNSPATSWPLLKSYYSGFFGAHAVLNSVGLGEIYLNAPIVQKLIDFADLTGVQLQPIGPGSFTYKVIDTGPSIGLLILQSSAGQGVHDGFWRRLCDHFSDLLQVYVDSGAPNAGQLVGEVDRIQNMVRDTQSRGVWLSNTRNAINYQHLYDCWLPNTRTSICRQLSFDPTYASSAAWDKLDHASNELERFLLVSRCFSSLSFEMAEYYVSAHGGNSPVGRRWRRLKALLTEQNT